MASKTTKGFGLSIFILLIGLYLSSKPPFVAFFIPYPKLWIVVIALTTTFAMMVAVNRFIKGESKEVFISGFVLSIVEAYVFLIQPNWAEALPPIGSGTELFFGFAFLFRTIFFLIEMTDNPIKKPLRRVIGE